MPDEHEVLRWARTAGTDVGRAVSMAGLPPVLDVRPGHPVAWQLRTLPQWANPPRIPEGLRVAIVDDDLDPRWVVRRLLAVPEVASVWAQTTRPPGALKPRLLQWPVRLAVARMDVDRDRLESEVYQAAESPSELFDVRIWEDDRRAVDVLIVRGRLLDTAAWAVAEAPVANTVIVCDRPMTRWPVTAASLAMIRGATAASVVGIAPPEVDPAYAFGRLVRGLAHANHLDVALIEAFDRQLFLEAEHEAFSDARLPELARRRWQELDIVRSAIAPPMAMAMPDTAVFAEAAEAAPSAFGHETDMASTMARAELELADFETAPEQRFLQTVVENTGPTTNSFATGHNDVHVWIGPEEADAIVSPTAFDESDFDWGEAASYRLTVVFAPQFPQAEPQRTDVELFKAGRTKRASFTLDIPQDAHEAAARIVVMFRNRVLQTAVLRGPLGERASLGERFVLRGPLGQLDDRRPFDLALVANHDDHGDPMLLANDDSTVVIKRLSPDLSSQITNISALLEQAISASLKPTASGLNRRTKAVALVRKLAAAGAELRKLLEEAARLGPLRDKKRISVLTAHANWELPIELIYDHGPPVEGAALCANYVATKGQGPCDTTTCQAAVDRTVVCPLGFWGLSRTIERFHVETAEADDLPGEAVLLGDVDPVRTPIKIRRSALAANFKVPQTQRDAVAKALGVPVIDTWNGWKGSLAQETDLLVIIPHTDYEDEIAPSLYIGSKDKLSRTEIEPPYVTGDHDLHPVVLLFGCKTTGTKNFPTGFVTRFMSEGKAAVIFTSLTTLLGSHAGEMARRLGVQLQTSTNPRPVSDHLVEFRKVAVWDGLLAGLALTAYGDAEWKV